MKKFFKNYLSSFLGAWTALLFFGFVVFIVAVALVVKAGLSSAPEKISDKSILVLDLKGEIIETERATKPDFRDLLNGELDRPATLDRLVEALGKAAEDDRIEALYIKCSGVSAQPATLDALRKAVLDFKKNSKKKVYAYGASLTESDYYVACTADSLFVNPQGQIALTGVAQVVPYMGELFDKIGIKFQIAKVGTFKSAVEPYTMKSMSEPAKAQLDTLCDAFWGIYKTGINESRGIKPAEIDSLVNSVILFSDVRSLQKTRLFDGICYEREMNQKFAALLDEDEDDLSFVAPERLIDNDFSIVSDDHIAILYATGEISETSDAGINWENLVPVILSLKDDDDVKGLVLRVNSPGGSVFGSEQIADALKQFKESKKPFAVSMGDYAASGGYWISCDADRIFANPMTITGSIGIFGIVPDCTPLLTNIGVSFQQVSTNPNGTFMPPFIPLNDAQMEAFTANVREGYDKFIERVASGRKMPEAKVRAIAEGRVWDGTRAMELGLVDQLGSLADAVKWVADKAGMKNPKTGVYPEVNKSLWDFIVDAELTPAVKALAGKNPGMDTMTLYLINRILTMNHCQARMADVSIIL